MILNRVFVYDDLLLTRIQKTLKITPINEIIAEATGKMYMMYRQPVMLLPNDITPSRGFRRVLGAILEFDDDQMEKVLYSLDNYKATSASRLGIVSPHDYTIRSIQPVHPITFKSIEQLQEYRYEYKRPVECYVYLGNPNNPFIIHNLTKNRHTKLSDGYYKRGFKELLYRKEVLHEQHSTGK